MAPQSVTPPTPQVTLTNLQGQGSHGKLLVLSEEHFQTFNQSLQKLPEGVQQGVQQAVGKISVAVGGASNMSAPIVIKEASLSLAAATATQQSAAVAAAAATGNLSAPSQPVAGKTDQSPLQQLAATMGEANKVVENERVGKLATEKLPATEHHVEKLFVRENSTSQSPSTPKSSFNVTIEEPISKPPSCVEYQVGSKPQTPVLTTRKTFESPQATPSSKKEAEYPQPVNNKPIPQPHIAHPKPIAVNESGSNPPPEKPSIREHRASHEATYTPKSSSNVTIEKTDNEALSKSPLSVDDKPVSFAQTKENLIEMKNNLPKLTEPIAVAKKMVEEVKVGVRTHSKEELKEFKEDLNHALKEFTRIVALKDKLEGRVEKSTIYSSDPAEALKQKQELSKLINEIETTIESFGKENIAVIQQSLQLIENELQNPTAAKPTEARSQKTPSSAPSENKPPSPIEVKQKIEVAKKELETISKEMTAIKSFVDTLHGKMPTMSKKSLQDLEKTLEEIETHLGKLTTLSDQVESNIKGLMANAKKDTPNIGFGKRAGEEVGENQQREEAKKLLEQIKSNPSRLPTVHERLANLAAELTQTEVSMTIAKEVITRQAADKKLEATIAVARKAKSEEEEKSEKQVSSSTETARSKILGHITTQGTEKTSPSNMATNIDKIRETVSQILVSEANSAKQEVRINFNNDVLPATSVVISRDNAHQTLNVTFTTTSDQSQAFLGDAANVQQLQMHLIKNLNLGSIGVKNIEIKVEYTPTESTMAGSNYQQQGQPGGHGQQDRSRTRDDLEEYVKKNNQSNAGLRIN